MSRGNRGDSQLAAGRRVSSHLLAGPGLDVPCTLSLFSYFKDVVHFSVTSGLPAAKSETFALFLFFSTARHFALFLLFLFSSSHCISKESSFLFEHYFVPFINLVISFATLR
ncbi:hypothetical protein M431DRAFT_265527 [Trichoderma harzianum CBS 226.95]|uniref:Uncharacterized protein n=1 Tax=Trichoderma harzianum CBS 226.95 TaxID=983964 RepID=A0A2T3ZY20_TRIHA|nr:hypothetical protein M431DRAFT_265527 [Trichoderma harzianum CBS 226.95]PTB49707.1 hypothetical protein M431DRAFT_265527 [Trichoderma harzianum CBS 226.95]